MAADRGIARDRPILLLSGNSVAHALVKFGGMAAGVPACPVSANYGLMDANFARLRHVVQLTRPGVVFVENAQPFARALEQVDFGDAIVSYRDAGRCAARRRIPRERACYAASPAP